MEGSRDTNHKEKFEHIINTNLISRAHSSTQTIFTMHIRH